MFRVNVQVQFQGEHEGSWFSFWLSVCVYVHVEGSGLGSVSG